MGCHCLLQSKKVKSENEVTQLCLTLRDPMDCSPPGSSIHGIFQARVLEWVAIAFSALIPKMLIFTLAISCLATFNLSRFKDLTSRFLCNIVLYSIRLYFHHWSHPQLGVVFALALSLHSFSGIISPLISSSILGTYRPGEFIFQCPIFLPFHTVHGVPKARILKWFTIPFSSGLHFVRTLHHDLSILGGPTGHGS